jgi:hypothetical protein
MGVRDVRQAQPGDTTPMVSENTFGNPNRPIACGEGQVDVGPQQNHARHH